MKSNHIIILLLAGIFALSSCDSWLTQKDWDSVSSEDAYSSDQGITSIISNLYSRLRYEQDFYYDGGAYDLCRWDEAVNNSQYWASAGNIDNNYRNNYDYGLIRDINLHLEELQTHSSKIAADNLVYYIAEARFLRALVYFSMVKRLGGVPLITETMEYVDNPATLARPRNKESEVYDFIANEIDAIKDDLDVPTATKTQTRATKGSALALKSRAMLYAGTLAYNYDKSATKGLNLASGATGIPKSRANEYLQKCVDASIELEDMNYYSLYQNDVDPATNYYRLFVTKEGNREIIFCKAYDGVNLLNEFAKHAIPRAESADKAGAEINPVLNLVNCYELVATREITAIKAYEGEEVIEVNDATSSSLDYRIYDNREDIFEGRDPRLAGTILYPGTSFRGKEIDFRTGLAVLQSDGSYTFHAAQTVNQIATANYEGIKLTGEDGPIRAADSNWYISHTGFLLRKYVDEAVGSETGIDCTVPYIVFRYAEVLLNAAEAAFLLNENGISTYNGQSTRELALNYINQVRERAGGSEFRLTDAELNFERIMNERRVELAYEDHRYYDLKRWRIADEIWSGNRDSDTAVLFGLWPYKIYAPGDEKDGKWLYRKVKAETRGSLTNKGEPIRFDLAKYYSSYPMDEGNTLVEKNPNQ